MLQDSVVRIRTQKQIFKGAVLLLGAFFILAASVGKESKNGDMAFFPAGEFMMGSPEGRGQKDERPLHKVKLDAFYLDRYEVSGKNFEEFIKTNAKQHPTITGWYDRDIRPDMANKPVIATTWKRCGEYCSWREKRLPTEAEWERAAAGQEGRLYPWGDQPPDAVRANFNKCCFIMKGNVLAGIFDFPGGQTPEGVYNLAGNIAEWVFDWYDPKYYQKSPLENPRGPQKGKYHVVRGGAWNSLSNYMRSADRYGYNDGQDFYGIGCRCARSAL